jgi:hypothetical protein
MLYYTQLIFIKEGQQEFFHQFEEFSSAFVAKPWWSVAASVKA